MTKSNSAKIIKIIRILLCVGGALLMLVLFTDFSEKVGTPLMDFFTTDYVEETGAPNSVAAIYLNYRMFDTIFEALMLMVCVMEVINVSWANTHNRSQRQPAYILKRDSSEIIKRMVGIVYPFILLIGFYIILNGHKSPGGGFQGGTILATTLITRYLVYPNFDVNLDLLEAWEKIFFIGIVLTPVLYLFMDLQPANTAISHEIYMMIMNTLIGLKVFSGLSVIFYRFVFFEGISYE